MNRMLLLFLWLVSSAAFAAGGDTAIYRWTPAATGLQPVTISTANEPQWVFYCVNPATHTPTKCFAGTGVTMSSGFINFNQVQTDWNAVSGMGQILNKPVFSQVGMTGDYNDLANKPILSPVATSGDFLDLINTPDLSVVAYSGEYSDLFNLPQFAPVATSGAYSDLSGTPSLFDGAWSSLTNVPATFAPSAHSHPRTYNNDIVRQLNVPYTISATRDARASYSISATWSLNALLGGNGTAFLEYSVDAGVNWTTVNQVRKSLNLLTVAGSDDMNLVGEIPANGLTRIRTTSANMTVAFVRGQEVLL